MGEQPTGDPRDWGEHNPWFGVEQALRRSHGKSPNEDLIKAAVRHRKMHPKDKQVAGDHYKKMAIQPIEYITKNGLGYVEGCVIKYVSRWKDKNGVEDLEKAIHYLEMLIAEVEGDE